MVSALKALNGESDTVASMEPCLFRHGKATDFTIKTGARHGLQWSHVFSDMVRDIILTKIEKNEYASMEPCLFRHGKGSLREWSVPDTRSFNGAMSFQTW